jgi:hypothetical protein
MIESNLRPKPLKNVCKNFCFYENIFFYRSAIVEIVISEHFYHCSCWRLSFFCPSNPAHQIGPSFFKVTKNPHFYNLKNFVENCFLKKVFFLYFSMLLPCVYFSKNFLFFGVYENLFVNMVQYAHKWSQIFFLKWM